MGSTIGSDIPAGRSGSRPVGATAREAWEQTSDGARRQARARNPLKANANTHATALHTAGRKARRKVRAESGTLQRQLAHWPSKCLHVLCVVWWLLLRLLLPFPCHSYTQQTACTLHCLRALRGGAEGLLRRLAEAAAQHRRLAQVAAVGRQALRKHWQTRLPCTDFRGARPQLARIFCSHCLARWPCT